MTDKVEREPPYEPDYPEPFPLEPLRNQLIIYELELKKTFLIMPNTAKARLGVRYARVVMAGKGTISPFTGEFMPTGIEKGQVVAFGEYGGSVFHHAGEPYKILQMGDVVCIVDLATFDPFTRLRDPDKSALPGLGPKLVRA